MKKLLLILVFLMHFSFGYTQNNHDFDYVMNKYGVHMEMSDPKDIKIIENSEEDFIVGEFVISYIDEKDSKTIFGFGISESGYDGRVYNLLKEQKGDLKIELSNGEIFMAYGAEIREGYGGLTYNAMIDIPASFLHSNKSSVQYGHENRKYVFRQFFTYDVSSIQINNYKFTFDTSVEKPFKTSKLIKSMIDDLSNRIEYKDNLSY